MQKVIGLSLLIWTSMAGAQQENNLPATDTTLSKPVISIKHALQKTRAKNDMIKSLKIPSILITYGFFALENDNLKALDHSIKNEIREDHPYFRTGIDDYLQFAPALAAYGLSAAGIKGRNNFEDRTMIYLLSNALMGITVHSLKKITRVQRPDGFGTNAFPSGHTAAAFVSAEFLRQEYKDVSPWYGIVGYLAAGATGALRMYKNKHWFRDILPGAGLGILSTRVAYRIFPTIKKKFFKNKTKNAVLMPWYQNGIGGVSLVYNFSY